MRQPSIARIDEHPARVQLIRGVAEPAPSGPRLTIAEVLGAEGAVAIVRVDGADLAARCAASCLLVPEPGDTALMCIGAPGDGLPAPVIVAIVARAPDLPATLAVPGASAVTVAADDLALTARRRVEIRGEECRIDATRTTIRGRALQLIADTLSGFAKRLSLVAGHMEASAGTASEVYGQRTSVVQGVESRSAGNLTIKVEQVMVVRAADALVAAQKDIRMDAERISLG